MSAPKVEIVNPIRFFSFFGLFLIFLFLAFRSCSDQKESTKYVDAKKITEEQEAELKKANTKELSNFITDIKKDLKNSDQIKDKDLTEEQLAALEDQNRSDRAKAELKKRAADKKAAQKAKERAAAKKKADVLKAKKAAVEKEKKAQASALSKQNIIVRTRDGRLSPLSRLQLKKTVDGSPKAFSKIMIYGYHGMDQPKGKAFVKAAEIKNTLIGLGVKRSVPIYMLTEQTRLPDAMGKVVFSR